MGTTLDLYSGNRKLLFTLYNICCGREEKRLKGANLDCTWLVRKRSHFAGTKVILLLWQWAVVQTKTHTINVLVAMWRYRYQLQFCRDQWVHLKLETVHNFYNSHTIELHKMQRHYVTLQLHTTVNQSYQIAIPQSFTLCIHISLSLSLFFSLSHSLSLSLSQFAKGAVPIMVRWGQGNRRCTSASTAYKRACPSAGFSKLW